MYLWKILKCINGDVAQLVEHLPEEQGVVSSILTVTTIGLSSEYVSGLKLGKAKW